MKPIAAALTLASLTLFLPAAQAERGVVFENSFERPAIPGLRMTKSEGGSFAGQDEHPGWAQLEDQPTAVASGSAGGGIVAGLTCEMVRSGNQAMFLEAQGLSVPYAGIGFASAPIHIVPGQEYVVTIWGRNDAQKPLVAGSPQLFLKLQVDFFSDAGNSQTGDSEYLLQALPGSVDYEPTFIPQAWRPLKKRVVAPADATYMAITYRVDLSPDKGKVSGLFYFDDVTVEGEKPTATSDATAVAPAAAGESAPQSESTPATTPATEAK
jgi:hypothetical protein